MAATESKNEVSVAQLFGEIGKFFRNGEYSQAQKSANKILKLVPNDTDALKCKIVCLIQQSCFQEALDGIVSAEKKKLLTMSFEKAYCLYRLNRLVDSNEVLQSIESPGLKEKELLAQVQYRLEDYSSCLDLYKDLIKNSADDYGDEREANMAAVVAAAKMWKNQNLGGSPLRTDTYELCYNYACLLLAQGNLGKAKSMLEESENLCRTSLESEEDITEEEIAEELGVMRAQASYIEQLQGKTESALACYNQILKKKPSDIALTAVVSNNVVAAHKDRELFDSKKRLKSMSLDGLQHKLTKAQQLKMQTNICLLHLYTNQIAQCKKVIENIKSNFSTSDEDTTALLEAAIFLRDKHNDQAMSHLESIVSSGKKANEAALTLAQLYLSKGKMEDALDALSKVNDIKYLPAMVSLCVSLYNILGKKKLAIEYLDEAIEYARKNPTRVKKEHLITYMKENSNLKLSIGDVESAVKMLEDLRKEDPSEIKTVAKIVAAYSQIDIKKAQKYSAELPALEKSKQDLDLDVLEMTDMIGSFRFSKKAAKQTEEGETKVEIGIKRKRRKKKKGKLPKNYNPDVDPDPERWLPRWERSTFKHKKQKRGTNTVGKGTQGAVGGADQPASPKPNSVSSPKANTSPAVHNSPGPSNVVPPRQQKPGAKSKPKKKKKGGGW